MSHAEVRSVWAARFDLSPIILLAPHGDDQALAEGIIGLTVQACTALVRGASYSVEEHAVYLTFDTRAEAEDIAATWDATIELFSNRG